MDSKEFKKIRKKIDKTQKQMAQLLGVSIKAVHSYEQGWRNIPANVERQMFFFLSRTKENQENRNPCWVIKNVLLRTKKNVRPGNFRQVIFAGLLTEPFAVVMLARTGMIR